MQHCWGVQLLLEGVGGGMVRGSVLITQSREQTGSKQGSCPLQRSKSSSIGHFSNLERKAEPRQIILTKQTTTEPARPVCPGLHSRGGM